MNIAKKVVVITGASDGIGRQIAVRLAAHHPVLVLIARNQERLQQVKDEAEKLGAKVKIFSCDVRDTAALTKTVGQIVADCGGVDVLINNAGVWPRMGSVDELAAEMVDEAIQTNLTAVMQITRLLLPELKKKSAAAIINIVSKSGVTAQKGQAVYSASKYGLRGFTEVLREDLKDTPVRVAGVYPGGVNTEIFAKAGEVGVPVGRFINPADLAEVITFLLTRTDSAWIYDVRIEHSSIAE